MLSAEFNARSQSRFRELIVLRNRGLSFEVWDDLFGRLKLRNPKMFV